MTPETLNPASARFDFMKWVSLNNKDISMCDDKSLMDSFLFNPQDEDEHVWESDLIG
ncbi:MAG: hypothetical protein R8M46_09305 [Ghiorsea sp.]